MGSGNPKGKPIFALHGGAGLGTYTRLTQYYTPEKFLIVLHDQRGAAGAGAFWTTASGDGWR